MRTRLATASIVLLASCFDPAPSDEAEGGSSGDDEGADARSTGDASTMSSSSSSSSAGPMPGDSSGDPEPPDVGETGWDGSTTALGESSSDDGSSTGCDQPDCDVDCEGVVDGDSIPDACGVCDSVAANDCIPAFASDESWTCEVGESCQDVYSITAFAGSTTTITVSSLTGASTVRTAVFAPGVPLDGPNLLTGQQLDWLCASTFTVAQFYAIETGVYRIAIGRDAELSVGQSGSYSLHIASTPGLVPAGLSSDDLPSQAQGTYCEI